MATAQGTAQPPVSLHDDVLLVVFDYLQPIDLAACAHTCRAWRDAVQRSRQWGAVWESLDAGRDALEAASATTPTHEEAFALCISHFSLQRAWKQGRYAVRWTPLDTTREEAPCLLPPYRGEVAYTVDMSDADKQARRLPRPTSLTFLDRALVEQHTSERLPGVDSDAPRLFAVHGLGHVLLTVHQCLLDYPDDDADEREVCRCVHVWVRKGVHAAWPAPVRMRTRHVSKQPAVAGFALLAHFQHVTAPMAHIGVSLSGGRLLLTDDSFVNRRISLRTLDLKTHKAARNDMASGIGSYTDVWTAFVSGSTSDTEFVFLGGENRLGVLSSPPRVGVVTMFRGWDAADPPWCFRLPDARANDPRRVALTATRFIPDPFFLATRITPVGPHLLLESLTYLAVLHDYAPLLRKLQAENAAANKERFAETPPGPSHPTKADLIEHAELLQRHMVIFYPESRPFKVVSHDSLFAVCTQNGIHVIDANDIPRPSHAPPLLSSLVLPGARTIQPRRRIQFAMGAAALYEVVDTHKAGGAHPYVPDLDTSARYALRVYAFSPALPRAEPEPEVVSKKRKRDEVQPPRGAFIMVP